MNPKIIAFSGTQGSGKTTMREKLTLSLKNQGKKVVGEYYGIESSISRSCQNFQLPINENTTFTTQWYIGSRYISADIETRQNAKMNEIDYVVLDRSVIDVIPYTMLSVNIKDDEKDLIRSTLLMHLSKFPPDYMVWCKPLGEETLNDENDKQRSKSRIFQLRINEQFKYLMNDIFTFEYPQMKLISMENDTIENRLKQLEQGVNYGV